MYSCWWSTRTFRQKRCRSWSPTRKPIPASSLTPAATPPASWPALNDVIGGRVSMMFIDLAPGLEHVRAGTLRALAVTTRERSALLPDLPSLHEAGISGYDVTSWAGLFAPMGTPKEIVARLNA